MFSLSEITAFFGPMVVVFCAVPFLRTLALRIGFVDKPGGRKNHEDDVPPIGGLIIFSAYLLALPILGVDIVKLWPLYAALLFVLIVGGLDDYKHINPWPRFAAQFIAAGLVVIPGHIRLDHLGDLFGTGLFELGVLSIPFTIVAVVLLINAINLMDGLDGFVGGQSFVVFAWLVTAAILAGNHVVFYPVLPLMGALIGFLIYNKRHPFRDRASIFLGDAGSMALGVIIAWFAIDFAQSPDAVIQPISVAWILAHPIMDICAQFLRRTLEKRHPFSPDRGHFHHHFIEAGLSVRVSTWVLIALITLWGAVGVLGVWYGVPQQILTWTWIIMLFAHMALSLRPKTYITLISRFRKM